MLARSWARAGGAVASRRTRFAADVRSAARSCARLTGPAEKNALPDPSGDGDGDGDADMPGGTMSLAYTMGARLAPSERSGLTLAVLASCGMLGGAISPIMAGFLGQLSLRVVFIATAAAYAIAVGLAALPSVRRAGMSEPAPATEADA